MHLILILGGILAGAEGSPVTALILMLALKTLVDLGAHLNEHQKFLRFNAK